MPGFVVDGTDSFISKMTEGGARASLFQAQIALAGLGSPPQGTDLADFKFICKGIQIPSNTLGITTVNYMGRAVKLPGNRSYEDLTTTVINDEGYSFRNQTEHWMANLNSHAGNVRATSHMAKLTGYTTQMYLNTVQSKSTGDSAFFDYGDTSDTKNYKKTLNSIIKDENPRDLIIKFGPEKIKAERKKLAIES